MKRYALMLGIIAALAVGVASAQVSISPGTSAAPPCIYACGDQPGRYLTPGQPIPPAPPAPTVPPGFPPQGVTGYFPQLGPFVPGGGNDQCGYLGGAWACYNPDGTLR